MNLLDKNASNLIKLYKTKKAKGITIYNFFPFRKLSLKEKQALLSKLNSKSNSKKKRKKKKTNKKYI
tara:strand:- start:15 stop:215 length:201 start_codon:yes stop_codon:yes gene_type:complete